MIPALVLTGLAALLHVYIWVMESFTWTSPATRAKFGNSAEEAAATTEMAFNQGFYNLFLAVIAAAGVVTIVADEEAIGAAMVFCGCGSMLAAALVLLASSPRLAKAAITQGLFPAAALVALVLALIT